MTSTSEYNVPSLLQMLGVHIRGKRADCPECRRPRAVSLNDEAFCCHGIDCNFRGGIGALRRRLGLRRERCPSAQYRELCVKRERAHEAAQQLYHAVHSRRMELLDFLHDLSRLGALVWDNSDPESTWQTLKIIYSDRQCITAELAILENSSTGELVRLL